MHIVYVTFEFPTEIIGGGLSSYLGNISKIMTDMGHKVTIITLSDTNERIKYKDNIYVERVRVPKNKITKHINRLRMESFYLNARLRKLKKKEKVDIVQYPNCRAEGLYRTSLPTVVRISSDSFLLRCADEVDMKAALKAPFNKRKTEDYLEDKALMKADCVFGPSKVIGEFIGERVGKSIRVIESPYYKDNTLVYDENTYRENLDGKKYLLTACSLRRVKGIHVIAGAIHEILEKHPDLYYALAGENEKIELSNGEKTNGVEYVIQSAGEYADRVVYLGNLTKKQLVPVIRNAYGIILPSRIDNLPNACIEAMGEGRIVIGTEGASFEQLITDGKNGLLIQRDSPDSLVEKVNELMGWTQEKRAAVEKEASDRVALMNAESIGKQVQKLYYETIKVKGGAE